VKVGRGFFGAHHTAARRARLGGVVVQVPRVESNRTAAAAAAGGVVGVTCFQAPQQFGLSIGQWTHALVVVACVVNGVIWGEVFYKWI